MYSSDFEITDDDPIDLLKNGNEAGFAVRIARLFIIIINIIFTLLGIYLVLTGSLFILNVNDLGKKILPISEPLIIPGLIILIGVVMFTIAFCGCCGACKFNSCLLILYSVVLSSLFFSQVVLGYYSYFKINRIETEIEEQTIALIDKYKYRFEYSYSSQEPLDLIQYHFKCCGSKNLNDYEGDIPWSCCEKIDIKEIGCQNNYYKNGCTKTLTNVFLHYRKILSAFAIFTCVIEIIAAVLASCVAIKIGQCIPFSPILIEN